MVLIYAGSIVGWPYSRTLTLNQDYQYQEQLQIFDAKNVWTVGNKRFMTESSLKMGDRCQMTTVATVRNHSETFENVDIDMAYFQAKCSYCC